LRPSHLRMTALASNHALAPRIKSGADSQDDGRPSKEAFDVGKTKGPAGFRRACISQLTQQRRACQAVCRSRRTKRVGARQQLFPASPALAAFSSTCSRQRRKLEAINRTKIMRIGA